MNYRSALALAFLLSTLNTACSVDTKDLADALSSQGEKVGPEYSQEQLSGKVFGEDWKAQTAVARLSKTNSKDMQVDFYSETIPLACGGQTSAKPYASLTLPISAQPSEYVMDTDLGSGNGNPMVFQSVANSKDYVMAQKTKIKILSFADQGFEALVYAQGKNNDGLSAEINGKIFVKDCSKAVDFSAWNDLAGWYKLKSFDGAEMDLRTGIIEFENDIAYDLASKKYLKTLVFPLYASVSSGSDMTYNFGPIEGLGTTKVSEENGIKTMTYSYDGPLNYKGMNITVKIDLKVVKSDSDLNVSYTLEIPNHVSKTTHQFVLVK